MTAWFVVITILLIMQFALNTLCLWVCWGTASYVVESNKLLKANAEKKGFTSLRRAGAVKE